MNNNFMRLQALKMELSNKQKQLDIKEMSSKYGIDKMALLIENNLDQAKLIIASQDVIEKLQKIAERLAELNAEEIMPLADSMKAAFGQEIAQKFEHVASQSIMAALESVRSAKDAIDNAVLQVEGKIAPEEDTDMAKYTPSTSSDVNDAGDTSDLTTDNTEDDSGTLLSTDDEDEASSNPLGRDLRDSINYEALGKKAISEGITSDLTKWYVSKQEKILSESSLKEFTSKLLSNLKNNKEYTLGEIYSKKLSESSDSIMRKVRAIASVIESNISSTGKSNTSNILKKFIGDNLHEESSQNILKVFCEEYGCSPVIYAAKLKKEKSISEDGPTNTAGAIASGSSSSQDIGTGTPTTPPNTRDEQMKDDAIANLASKVATNPGVLNQPVATAASTLNPEEKTAINNTISKDESTDSSTTVKDFLQKQQNNGLNS